MPDPSLLIWAFIAIAVILLWPIRRWMRARYDRDNSDGSDGPMSRD